MTPEEFRCDVARSMYHSQRDRRDQVRNGVATPVAALAFSVFNLSTLATAAHLRPYQPPAAATSAPEATRRKVDKTGLISWRANKYTVPLRYQRSAVDVVEDGGELHIIEAPDRGRGGRPSSPG